jgi:hypothetical protein
MHAQPCVHASHAPSAAAAAAAAAAAHRSARSQPPPPPRIAARARCAPAGAPRRRRRRRHAPPPPSVAPRRASRRAMRACMGRCAPRAVVAGRPLLVHQRASASFPAAAPFYLGAILLPFTRAVLRDMEGRLSLTTAAAAAAVPGTSSSSYPQQQVGVHQQQPLHCVAPPALGSPHTGGGYAAAAASAASMVETGMSSTSLPLPPPQQQQQQQHWDHRAAAGDAASLRNNSASQQVVPSCHTATQPLKTAAADGSNSAFDLVPGSTTVAPNFFSNTFGLKREPSRLLRLATCEGRSLSILESKIDVVSLQLSALAKSLDKSTPPECPQCVAFQRSCKRFMPMDQSFTGVAKRVRNDCDIVWVAVDSREKEIAICGEHDDPYSAAVAKDVWTRQQIRTAKSRTLTKDSCEASDARKYMEKLISQLNFPRDRPKAVEKCK